MILRTRSFTREDEFFVKVLRLKAEPAERNERTDRGTIRTLVRGFLFGKLFHPKAAYPRPYRLFLQNVALSSVKQEKKCFKARRFLRPRESCRVCRGCRVAQARYSLHLHLSIAEFRR